MLNDPLRRYNFLVQERAEFRGRNSNYEDADEIISMFDHLIKLEKFKLEDLAWEASERENQLRLEKLEPVLATLPPSITECEQPNIENPYPRIFVNGSAFLLFEHWHNQVPQRSQLAEYSFIYWSMVKDGYIYTNVRPTEFINFLNKAYEVDLSILKQLSQCNGGNKDSRYTTAKLIFPQ